MIRTNAIYTARLSHVPIVVEFMSKKPAPAAAPRGVRKQTPRTAAAIQEAETGTFHVEQWPLTRIKQYEKNARRIPHAAIEKVSTSLATFGWRQPIVVDTEGVIVVGHTRLLAAEKLGLTEAPVHVATDLTPEQIRAYRLMDNRSHQETEWDYDLLSPELESLGSLDFDLSLTGFDMDEIGRFLGKVPDVTFREYDESIAGQVKYQECPQCGHKFPK